MARSRLGTAPSRKEALCIADGVPTRGSRMDAGLWQVRQRRMRHRARLLCRLAVDAEWAEMYFTPAASSTACSLCGRPHTQIDDKLCGAGPRVAPVLEIVRSNDPSWTFGEISGLIYFRAA